MRRFLTSKCSKPLAFTLVVAALAGGAQSAEAAKIYENLSPYDTLNSRTDPRYDVQYISVAEWDESPNSYYFYLYFAQPIFQSQFSDGRGSWAAVLIDANLDGNKDFQLETDGYLLPVSNTTVRGSGPNGCSVDVYSNIGSGVRWLAFRANKSCLGLGDSFGVMGYADYIENDNAGFDYGPDDFWRFTRPGSTASTTTSTTTTTTTTTTTVVPVPNAPSSVAVTALDGSSVQVNWLDNSSGEQGFLIQRNDLPVPAGTTVDAWPYKVGTDVTQWSVSGLAPGSQVCFAVAAFNGSGASRFTDFACLNLVTATTTTTATSLTCDARWSKRSRASVLFTISAGTSNAGKRLSVEAFVRGKWVKIGKMRVTADGEAASKLRGSTAKISGTLPIRATQGSRFICEGQVK